MSETKNTKTNILLFLLILSYLLLTTIIFILRKQHQKIDTLLATQSELNLQVKGKKSKQITSIEQCKKQLQQNSQNDQLHFQIAQLYMAQKENQKKALHHLKQVLKINPSHKEQSVIQIWIKNLSQNQ